MKSENQKGESESDWDSMSEMQQCPASDSAKSKTDVNTSYGVPSRDEEIPPYSFKHEGENPSNPSPSERPPGKPKKGRIYDPSSSQEESTEGTLPRKLKPLPVTHLSEMENRNSKFSPVFGPKNHLKSTGNYSEALQSDFMKGIHNSGFIRDDYDKKESDIDEEDEEDDVDGGEERNVNSGRRKGNFGVLRNKRLFKNSNKNYESKISKPSRNFFHPTPMTNIGTNNSNFGSSKSKETSESPFRGRLSLIDSFFEKAFHTLSFPFACFFMLLHHCIKFLLVGIVHPLLIESLFLFSKYFIEPFSTKVLKPILRTFFAVFEILTTILAKVLFPLTEVLRSFRLVEINVNKHQDTLCV